jgi:hypothetical protein
MTSLRRALPWIVLTTLVVRFPGFVWQILGHDDADATVAARMIAAGAIPYRDVVDIKPPLFFLCYLPNAWIRGAYWPVQIEGALVVVATSIALGLAARRTWGRERAGVLAAFLALAVGLCEAPTVSSELLMNLPTAIALSLFARAETETHLRDDALAGVFLGLALLLRPQAAFTCTALALATSAIAVRTHRPWVRRQAAFAIGIATPWLATVAIFGVLGALPEFMHWVVVRNISYVGQHSGSTLVRGLRGVGLCIVAAAPVAWWVALTGVRSTLRALRSASALSTSGERLRATWVLLLVLSAIALSLGGRFYEHYFLQLVPAAALLGAGPLDDLLERAQGWSRARRASLLALAVLPPCFQLAYVTARGVLHEYPLQNSRVQQIGQWARTRTSPESRMFVWGHDSAIYLAADRLPATRYITTCWQLSMFDAEHITDDMDVRALRSRVDERWTLDDLARARPEWIVDTSPANLHSYGRLPMSLLPDLEAAIDVAYEPISLSPGGARVLQRRQ